jgi:hypothetical protein
MLSGSARPSIPDAPVPYPMPADIATPPFYDPYAVKLATYSNFANPHVTNNTVMKIPGMPEQARTQFWTCPTRDG